ncbi:MAG TPA: hypothetical protein PLM79_09715 [Syntrophobacteraceae bacterium]|nr:hypothetical protein [Syntrophobacteraceae bacterium]
MQTLSSNGSKRPVPDPGQGIFALDSRFVREEAEIFVQGVRAVIAFVQPNMGDLNVRSILESNGHTGTSTRLKADLRQMSDL